MLLHKCALFYFVRLLKYLSLFNFVDVIIQGVLGLNGQTLNMNLGPLKTNKIFF